MSNKKPCPHCGMNEDCQYCGGSGFIDSEDQYEKIPIQPQEQPIIPEPLSKETLDLIHSTIQGKRNQRLGLSAIISQTTASSGNKSKISLLNVKLQELEANVKAMYMSQEAILKLSDKFNILLKELIATRKAFNSKYRRCLTLFDKHKLEALIPDINRELEKRRIAELQKKWEKK